MPVGPGEFCTVPPAEAVLRGCVLYGLLLPHSVPSGYCISFVLFQIVLVVTQNYDLCTNRLDNSFFFQRFVWITLFDEITLGSEASTANCVCYGIQKELSSVFTKQEVGSTNACSWPSPALASSPFRVLMKTWLKRGLF
jgi:hypothetical protein